MTKRDIPDTFYIWLKPVSIGSNKCHFISEVVDGDTTLVIFKNWSKHRNQWTYYTEVLEILQMKLKSNEGADGKTE